MSNKKHTGRAWWESWWVRVLGFFLLIGIIILVWWHEIVQAEWDVLNSIISKMDWPFVILVVILVLHNQIGDFLINLGSSLGRLRQLKIGENFTFTADEIIEVLVDREKLKMGILIAAAENGIGPEETENLVRLAYPLKSEVQRLSKEQKTRVMEEIIIMALMDKKIQKEEYTSLNELADLYNKNKSGDEKIDLDELVARACYYKNGKPPDQLKPYYGRKKLEYEKEKP